MKRILLGAAALVTAMGAMGASTAFADPYDHHDNGYHNGWGHDGRRNHDWRGGDHRWYGRDHGWRRGEYIPRNYFDRYEAVDYRHHHLRAPPYGYRYVRDDRGDILLAAIATGLVVSVIASH